MNIILLTLILLNEFDLALQKAKSNILSSIALKEAKEKIIPKIDESKPEEIKPEEIKEPPQEVKEPEEVKEPTVIIQNIFTDYNLAVNECLKNKKHLIIWINCWDEELCKITGGDFIHLRIYNQDSPTIHFYINKNDILYLKISTIHKESIKEAIKSIGE